MPVIAVMIGIQASGKSTFCNTYLCDYVHISLDKLHTRTKENRAVETAIAGGNNIVIDNTNPTAEVRKKYIQSGKNAGYKVVGYFMQSKLQDCIRRNNAREGKAKIPVQAIAHTSNILELPCYDEGFDELYFVEITDDIMQISEWRNE